MKDKGWSLSIVILTICIFLGGVTGLAIISGSVMVGSVILCGGLFAFVLISRIFLRSLHLFMHSSDAYYNAPPNSPQIIMLQSRIALSVGILNPSDRAYRMALKLAVQETFRTLEIRGEAKFKKKWRFFAAIFLRPSEVEDFLTTLDELFEHDCKRFGLRSAKILYRKRAAMSVAPIVNWAMHRLMAIEAIKRLLE